MNIDSQLKKNLSERACPACGLQSLQTVRKIGARKVERKCKSCGQRVHTDYTKRSNINKPI